jgi:hypothetical protein
MAQIQTEFGGSSPISLSEYYGSAGAPSSGAISMSDFYGKSGPNLTYASRLTNATTYTNPTSVNHPSGTTAGDLLIYSLSGYATNTAATAAPNAKFTSTEATVLAANQYNYSIVYDKGLYNFYSYSHTLMYRIATSDTNTAISITSGGQLRGFSVWRFTPSRSINSVNWTSLNNEDVTGSDRNASLSVAAHTGDQILFFGGTTHTWGYDTVPSGAASYWSGSWNFAGYSEGYGSLAISYTPDDGRGRQVGGYFRCT